MRLVWATDPHLNHVPEPKLQQWLNAVASHGADGIVISGDISEGDDVVFQLQRIAGSSLVPIYFVLGNHDFYRSSIAATRRNVIGASREIRQLHYLTDMPAIELAEGVFLAGEDGWGDAAVGDYEQSTIRLNDFQLIDDFRTSDPRRWKEQLHALGAASAQRLGAKLDAIAGNARSVLVVTHVPPFRDACWYEGKTTDDNWAPFFVCGAVGEMLRRASASLPGCQFTAVCGHTHHAGVARITPNLVVYTGAANYGHPDIEGFVSIEHDGISITRTR